MIKHLLIAITLLAGCDGHWFYACDDPNKPPGTTYCTTDSTGGDSCEGEGQHTYYVWYLGADCAEIQDRFCAADDESAQTYAYNQYADVGHGAASLDPHATEPTKITMCASGGDCVLGSSDESYGTTFWYFTDDQIAICEAGLDPGCTTWVPVDPNTNMCPGQM